MPCYISPVLPQIGDGAGEGTPTPNPDSFFAPAATGAGGFLLSATPAPAAQLWEATLAQLMLRVTRQNYDTWLRSTMGCHYDGSTLIVKTNSDLACDWLSTRMRSVIAQSLTAVAGGGVSVRFEPSEMPAALADEPRQPALMPRQEAPLNPRFTFTSFLQ